MTNKHNQLWRAEHGQPIALIRMYPAAPCLFFPPVTTHYEMIDYKQRQKH